MLFFLLFPCVLAMKILEGEHFCIITYYLVAPYNTYAFIFKFLLTNLKHILTSIGTHHTNSRTSPLHLSKVTRQFTTSKQNVGSSAMLIIPKKLNSKRPRPSLHCLLFLYFFIFSLDMPCSLYCIYIIFE